MNIQIEKLYKMAASDKRWIIGLMSGTSLDGLDIALCLFSGAGVNTKVEVKKFKTVNYSNEIKEKILSVFAKKNISFEALTLINPWLAKIHSEMILTTLKEWDIKPYEIDVIASHGQTVFHLPYRLHKNSEFGNATFQIGDGDHIAVNTGIITLSDFRQKHIAAGGEGAPLALYGDCLLFNKIGVPTLLLNIGGIANFTYLPGKEKFDGALVTDTGPGNTLLDAVIKEYYPYLKYDVDGQIASGGSINYDVLELWKSLPFFKESIPKTTGPELFEWSALMNLSKEKLGVVLGPQDLLATLTLLSAETITDCIKKEVPNWRETRKFVSGGGCHNKLLMSHIQRLLPGSKFLNPANLGIPGDAKEAVLFAVLANETLSGGNTTYGENPSVCMGKISLPS
ncbi:MAG: anhydro-N-acetylmuramic acid kinase [Bacteroidota bacterium]